MALATGLGELAGEAVHSAKLARKLRRLSETDPLTGLANHRHVLGVLTAEVARAERGDTQFSVVMLDIDGFKSFNDTYGHPVGDVILRQVADLLDENTRTCDVVGRYVGDEFVLVLPETSLAGAGALVEKMHSKLGETPYVTPTGERIPIHASFGIAVYPNDGLQVNELVVVADANLYASKHRGGDAVTGTPEDHPDQEHEQGSFGILESLVAAVDNKDSYTRHHSDEVTV